VLLVTALQFEQGALLTLTLKLLALVSPHALLLLKLLLLEGLALQA
jgi:hypothetical protein